MDTSLLTRWVRGEIEDGPSYPGSRPAAPIWRAYAEYWENQGDPIPRAFGRHPNAHAVSRTQYSRVNAVISSYPDLETQPFADQRLAVNPKVNISWRRLDYEQYRQPPPRGTFRQPQDEGAPASRARRMSHARSLRHATPISGRGDLATSAPDDRAILVLCRVTSIICFSPSLRLHRLK